MLRLGDEAKLLGIEKKNVVPPCRSLDYPCEVQVLPNASNSGTDYFVQKQSEKNRRDKCQRSPTVKQILFKMVPSPLSSNASIKH